MSATQFDSIYDAFFRLIEKDISFFQYFDYTEEQAMELAKNRAEGLLHEAIEFLHSRSDKSHEIQIEDGDFTITLNGDEIQLLAKLMLLCYMEHDLAILRTRVNTFSSSDLKALHSPANERNSFINMVDNYREECTVEISEYSMRDRNGKRIGFNGYY